VRNGIPIPNPALSSDMLHRHQHMLFLSEIEILNCKIRLKKCSFGNKQLFSSECGDVPVVNQSTLSRLVWIG